MFFISMGQVGEGGGGEGFMGAQSMLSAQLSSVEKQKFNNHTNSSKTTHHFSDSRPEL